MPKVSKTQVDAAANAVYQQLIGSLGLQKALTCNLQVGRLLRAEKKRRKTLDEKATPKNKTKRKTNKSKTSNGNKEGSDVLPKLTSRYSGGSGNACRRA